MRTRSRRAALPATRPSRESGCTTASSASTTRRCRSRSATSSPCATSCRGFGPRCCARSCSRATTGRPSTTRTRTCASRIPPCSASISRCATSEPAEGFPPGEASRQFAEAMDDDFNTPGAIAALQDLARELNVAKTAGDALKASALAAELRQLGGVLGLLEYPPAEWLVDRFHARGRRGATAEGLDPVADRSTGRGAHRGATAASTGPNPTGSAMNWRQPASCSRTARPARPGAGNSFKRDASLHESEGARPLRRVAASSVFFMSAAIVIGPTPPGTGVM